MPRIVAIRDQQQPQYRKYLLLSNDKVLASARTRQQRRGEARVISDLHVEPEYRNIGLGRMIMAGILEREPRPVALRVGAYGAGDKPNDEQLTKFYTSLGFEPAEGGYMRKAAAGTGWQLGAATADDIAGGVAGVGVNKLINGTLGRHLAKQPQLANMGEWATSRGAPGAVRGNDYLDGAFAWPNGDVEIGKGWATPSIVAHEVGHTQQPAWLKTVAPALRMAPPATAVDWGDAGFQLGRNGRIDRGTAARMGAGVAAGVVGAADEMDAWRRAGQLTDVDPKARALSLASYLAPNVTVGGGRFASGYVRGLGENPNITNKALRVVSRAAPVAAGAAGLATRAQAYYGQNHTLHAAGDTAGGLVKGLATTPAQLTGKAPVNPVAVTGRYAAMSAGEQVAPAVSGALNDLKSRVSPEVYAAIKDRASQGAASVLGAAERTSLPGEVGRLVGEAAGPISANMAARDLTRWGLSRAVGRDALKRVVGGPLYAASAGAVDLGQQMVNPNHFAGIAEKSKALDTARRFVVGAPVTRRTLLAERILNLLSHPIAMGTGAVTDAVRGNPDGMHKHLGNIVRDAYREVVPERSIMDRYLARRPVKQSRLFTQWELRGWGESKEEGRRRSAIVDQSAPGSTQADWEATKEAVVVQRDGKWQLLTKDRSRVLGTHDTAQEAYKQEYAIHKSQEKAAGALPMLLEAKAHSDKKDYARKHAILRGIIASAPSDFVIDSQSRGITGITHVPTNFAIHMPTRAVPSALTARSPAIAKKKQDEPVTGAEKTASMHWWLRDYRMASGIVERVPHVKQAMFSGAMRLGAKAWPYVRAGGRVAGAVGEAAIPVATGVYAYNAMPETQSRTVRGVESVGLAALADPRGWSNVAKDVGRYVTTPGRFRAGATLQSTLLHSMIPLFKKKLMFAGVAGLGAGVAPALGILENADATSASARAAGKSLESSGKHLEQSMLMGRQAAANIMKQTAGSNDPNAPGLMAGLQAFAGNLAGQTEADKTRPPLSQQLGALIEQSSATANALTSFADKGLSIRLPQVSAAVDRVRAFYANQPVRAYAATGAGLAATVTAVVVGRRIMAAREKRRQQEEIARLRAALAGTRRRR